MLCSSPVEGIFCGGAYLPEEHRWEIRRQVGMVFQNPDNQIVATTVEEDVAFGLRTLVSPKQFA